LLVDWHAVVQVLSKEYGARGEAKKSDWQGTFIDQRL
jgi:hypothetical protein